MISDRTQERWLTKYREQGLAFLLVDESKNRTSKIITPQIHGALEAKVSSSGSPFLFSKHHEKEYKVVIIYNAGFHSTKNIDIPDNIYLLNIPPYSPELNPREKIWQHFKSRFKNQTFDTMKSLKEWLADSVKQMTEKQIMSITHNKKYLDYFHAAFSG